MQRISCQTLEECLRTMLSQQPRSDDGLASDAVTGILNAQLKISTILPPDSFTYSSKLHAGNSKYYSMPSAQDVTSTMRVGWYYEGGGLDLVGLPSAEIIVVAASSIDCARRVCSICVHHRLATGQPVMTTALMSVGDAVKDLRRHCSPLLDASARSSVL